MNDACAYQIHDGTVIKTCAVFGWAHDKHALVKEFPHPFTPKATVATDGYLPQLPQPACTYADHSYPAYTESQLLQYGAACRVFAEAEISRLRAIEGRVTEKRDDWLRRASICAKSANETGSHVMRESERQFTYEAAALEAFLHD